MTNSRTAVRRGGIRRVLAAMIAFVALVAGIGLAAGPASAHTGGKAIVLVSDLNVAPATKGWTATAVLKDLDGGGNLVAADVQAKGGGLAAYTQMVETATPGTYEVSLPKAAPGPITFSLRVRTNPGGAQVAPFDKTYTNTLVAGQTLSLATGKVESGGGDGGGGGGSNTGMIVGVAGAVILVAVLFGVFSVRKRTAVPARAK